MFWKTFIYKFEVQIDPCSNCQYCFQIYESQPLVKWYLVYISVKMHMHLL